MFLFAAEWMIKEGEGFTFAVELIIFVGFVAISGLLFQLRSRFPELTTRGWIELIIGAPLIALKGLFDGLDTVAPDGVAHDIFDYGEAVLFFIGLILLGIGLLRMALYSAKVWEVR
ncbi:MAG: hypothetical protein GF308_08900 [Candidatus Heimdallarchaeota archaeon]|nr:hypothetical protein [Candidatus Heimdallarchaeota archaeon]